MAFTYSNAVELPYPNGAGGIARNVITKVMTMTGPASYTTGGESASTGAATDAAQYQDFGIASDAAANLKLFKSEVTDDGTDERFLTYDRTAHKIRAWNINGSEVSNTTNLSAVTFQVLIVGIQKNIDA